jgi:hypothetical protein
MEIILEFIFSFLGELILQIIAELLIESGFHGLANIVKSRKDRNPYLAFIGYCLLGTIVGFISLAIFPALFITGETFVLINLLVTPVLAGLAMSAIGRWRTKKGKNIIRLDSFIYGFSFALCMALVRYGFGDLGA